MKTVITYGTFDIFHIGHLNMIQQLANMGDRLIVAVSTDEFNESKGKTCLLSYEDRSSVVRAIRHVDEVIPEHSWSQKAGDIRGYEVDVFGIGDDWRGKFDELKQLCEVIYLPRTHGISSTEVKSMMASLSVDSLYQIERSVERIREIFTTFGVK